MLVDKSVRTSYIEAKPEQSVGFNGEWKIMLGKPRTALLSVVTLVLLAGAGVAPSHADPGADLADAAAITAALAPERVAPRSDEITVEASAEAGRGVIGSAVQIDVSANGLDRSVSFVLDDDLKLTADSSDFLVAVDDDSTSATYVKANPAGAQVFFSAADSSGLDNMSVTFDVAQGAALAPVRSGGYFLDLADGTTIHIDEPWAVDASGNELSTAYQLSGATLTQTVQVGDSTDYPILADPNWTYGWDYGIGARNPGSAQYVMTQCFNCYFPVEGAPDDMPTTNDLLPLVVRPFPGGPAMNFECTFVQQVLYSSPGFSMWEMIFAATHNHVDGYGSSIQFQIFKKEGESTYTLRVFGYIVNDNPGGIPNPVYVNLAVANWITFANNLYI